MNPTTLLLLPEIELLCRDASRLTELRNALHGIHPADVAELVTALSPTDAAVAFRVQPRDDAAAVFSYLDADRQEQLIGKLGDEQAVTLFEAMPPDDRARLLDELPEAISQRIINRLRPETRRVTQVILGYREGTVGRAMTPDYVSLTASMTVAESLDEVRKRGRDAETINVLYVVDGEGRLVDDLRLRSLLLADPSLRIQDLMNRSYASLRADQPQSDAVDMMARYDRTALPVIDSRGVLLGIVTIDDVTDIERRETTQSIHRHGGVEALDEPYSTITLWKLLRKRGGWLAALFLGELLTASAMGHFQTEIEKAAVIAIFLPLIISSGGNSGSQASTLIIRAMAVGELSLSRWWWVLRRELACGLILGLFLGGIGAARIHLWQWLHLANYDTNRGYVDAATHSIYDIGGLHHWIALTVGISLIGVVLWGTICGAMLPFVLRKFRLDPATISAPLVATLVDVTGLIIYFTVAAIVLRGTLL